MFLNVPDKVVLKEIFSVRDLFKYLSRVFIINTEIKVFPHQWYLIFDLLLKHNYSYQLPVKLLKVYSCSFRASCFRVIYDIETSKQKIWELFWTLEQKPQEVTVCPWFTNYLYSYTTHDVGFNEGLQVWVVQFILEIGQIAEVAITVKVSLSNQSALHILYL